MLLRQEQPTDYNVIYALVQSAFATAEHADGNEQDIVVALRMSDAYIPRLALVAEQDEVIVGHALFTVAHVGDEEVLALAPLSVLPACQNRGIGGELICEGHAIAKAFGYNYCVVLGSDTYYPKFGYVPASQYGIVPPEGIPMQYLMAIKLQDDAPALHGTIVYAKELLGE